MHSARSRCCCRCCMRSTFRPSCSSSCGSASASTGSRAAGAFAAPHDGGVLRGRSRTDLSGMSETRVFGLDFLRALAILLVLVAHATFMFLPLTHQLEAWWMFGQLGVALFFVLSGFLIGAILVKQAEAARVGVGRFWLRRWLRTLPNYYLFLVINIGLARWIDG